MLPPLPPEFVHNDAYLEAVAIALIISNREYVSDPEQFTLARDDIFNALVTVRDTALATANAKLAALTDELTDANIELHAAIAKVEQLRLLISERSGRVWP